MACLACESTNVLEEGDDAREEDLLPRMEEVFRGCTGAIAATTFGSNLQRMRTLALAAEACGRRVVVVGRAMWRMLEVANATGMAKGFPAWNEHPARVRSAFGTVLPSHGQPGRTPRGDRANRPGRSSLRAAGGKATRCCSRPASFPEMNERSMGFTTRSPGGACGLSTAIRRGSMYRGMPGETNYVDFTNCCGRLRRCRFMASRAI